MATKHKGNSDACVVRRFCGCRGAVPPGLRVQQSAAAGRGREGGLVGGGESVSAPCGSHPQPREHGEGLRRAGAEGAGRRDRGSRQGRLDTGDARGAQQPGAVPQVPGGSGPAQQRPQEPVCGHRELPAAEVGSELPRPAVADRRHGESHHRGTRTLYRSGAGLQRHGPLVPGEPDGQDVRLPGEAELHRGQRAADRHRTDGQLRYQHAGDAGCRATPPADQPKTQ